MKLCSIAQVFDDIQLGICEIGVGRAEERCGAAELLKAMLGYEVEINHNADGKPLIPYYNISITHTKGFLAILLSKKHSVGIDIEYVSDRIHRVAHRLLRADESYTATDDLLKVWCAKEAIYKLFSAYHLGFQDAKIDLLTEKAELLQHDIILLGHQFVPLRITMNDKYAMVITWI